MVSIQSNAVPQNAIFMSSFLFYCLLLNHSFPTNSNKITNCFKLILSIYNFTNYICSMRFVYFWFFETGHHYVVFCKKNLGELQLQCTPNPLLSLSLPTTAVRWHARWRWVCVRRWMKLITSKANWFIVFCWVPCHHPCWKAIQVVKQVIWISVLSTSATCQKHYVSVVAVTPVVATATKSSK